MENEDMLISARNRVTQYREKITKYGNIWKEYQSREPTYFKKDVENTFTDLLYNFKNLMNETELLWISHETLKERVYILENYLSHSPHIEDNPNMRQKFYNELKNLKDRYVTQCNSFLKYFEKENQ